MGEAFVDLPTVFIALWRDGDLVDLPFHSRTILVPCLHEVPYI
jgi:hypothetical protein